MSKLDRRKPHVVYGGGPGKDIFVQDGKLYTSAGRELPADERKIEADYGIPVHPELRVYLAGQRAQAEFAAQEQRIRAAVLAAERKERARIVAEAEGLPVEDEAEDEVLLPDEDEVEPEPVPVVKPVRRGRKPVVNN